MKIGDDDSNDLFPYACGKSIFNSPSIAPLKSALDDIPNILKQTKIRGDFDFGGYPIIVSPKIGGYMKGLRQLLEDQYESRIRNIQVNEEKRLVTVVFTDGTHEIIKCAEDDHFDVHIGVALAIVKHLYGSKNKFHKDVAKKTKIINTKDTAKNAKTKK